MNRIGIRTQFEDLSVELIVEILEYFTANEIYFSFSRLNIRFDSILKSLCNLLLIIKKKWIHRSILSLKHSNKSMSILIVSQQTQHVKTSTCIQMDFVPLLCIHHWMLNFTVNQILLFNN